MLLFKQRHVGPILSGAKTVTRRVGGRRWKVGAVHQCYTKPPFSKGGSKPFAAIRIMDVEWQSLGRMKELDAKAEGCSSLADFRQAWRDMHGWWDAQAAVWVVRFELAEVR